MLLSEPENGIHMTIGRITGLIRRQRWPLMLVSSGISLAAIAVVLRLPDRFTSEATLMVVQQQVSQRYVEPSTNVTVPDAVQAMGRQILSRARLMGIINELGLYANARNRLTPEQLVAAMRNDVSVDPLDESRGNFSAFRVSFTAGSAETAQAVTGRLTTLFIEEQSKTRTNQAETTTKFLKEQLEEAKQRLNALDERSRAFKTEYLGELPERQSVNFAMLTELRSQLQTVSMGLSRAQQQRMTLQTSIGDHLTRLQTERAKLLTRYTPRYSEVVAKDQEIAKVTALLERLKSRTPVPDKALEGAIDDPALGTLLSQVQANELEMESLLKEERRLKAESAQYQRGLNLAPVREQQLGGIPEITICMHRTYGNCRADCCRHSRRAVWKNSRPVRNSAWWIHLLFPTIHPVETAPHQSRRNRCEPRHRTGRCLPAGYPRPLFSL